MTDPETLSLLHMPIIQNCMPICAMQKGGNLADRMLKEKRHSGKSGLFCGHCPYKEESEVKGGGQKNGTMLVGEGPGQTDARAGRCFTGLTGNRLKKQLGKAGLLIDDC